MYYGSIIVYNIIFFFILFQYNKFNNIDLLNELRMFFWCQSNYDVIFDMIKKFKGFKGSMQGMKQFLFFKFFICNFNIYIFMKIRIFYSLCCKKYREMVFVLNFVYIGLFINDCLLGKRK